MGAETRVYVKVRKWREEWIEVSAVTLDEAMRKAKEQDWEVVMVLEASYEPGGVVT